MSEPSAPVSGAATAFGGEQLTVEFRAARADLADATGETVLVRELEIDPGLLKFGQLVDKPAELAEFVCDRPAGWGKSLKRESLLAVFDKAIDLNFTVARLYLQSRAKLLQEINKATASGSPSTTSASAPA